MSRPSPRGCAPCWEPTLPRLTRVRITVVGAGYVGLSNAVLLAQRHDVRVLDLDAAKISLLENRQSPVEDAELEQYLADRELSLAATTDPFVAYDGAELVVVATPTDYDPQTNFF